MKLIFKLKACKVIHITVMIILLTLLITFSGKITLEEKKSFIIGSVVLGQVIYHLRCHL